MKKYALNTLMLGSVLLICCLPGEHNKGRIEDSHDTTYVIMAKDSSTATRYYVHGRDTAVSSSSNPSSEYWERHNNENAYDK